MFYFLTLGGLFISVSSYFFEREKGFGITTEKKDKGYSRWAKESEIKKTLSPVDPKAYTADAANATTTNTNDESDPAYGNFDVVLFVLLRWTERIKVLPPLL